MRNPHTAAFVFCQCYAIYASFGISTENSIFEFYAPFVVIISSYL